MKHLGSALMIIVVVVALIGCSKSEYRILKLEETIKRQEEEIKQLQAEISEQEKNKQINTKQATRNKDSAIANALRGSERYKRICCNIDASDGVVRVYFCDIMDAVFFLESREAGARLDLNHILEKTGNSTGSIEYYTPHGKKIFSISGSLSRAETKTYK